MVYAFSSLGMCNDFALLVIGSIPSFVTGMTLFCWSLCDNNRRKDEIEIEFSSVLLKT